MAVKDSLDQRLWKVLIWSGIIVCGLLAVIMFLVLPCFLFFQLVQADNQRQPTEPAPLEQRVDSLEKRLSELERRVSEEQNNAK